MQDYLEDQVTGNPKPSPGVESPREKEVIADRIKQLPKDLADCDILEEVQNRPANVTIGK